MDNGNHADVFDCNGSMVVSSGDKEEGTGLQSHGFIPCGYADRAVSCVNACAGLSDEEIAMIGKMFALLREHLRWIPNAE